MSTPHAQVPALVAAAGEATALGAMVVVVAAASAVAVGSVVHLALGTLTGGRAFLASVPSELRSLRSRR